MRTERDTNNELTVTNGVNIHQRLPTPKPHTNFAQQPTTNSSTFLTANPWIPPTPSSSITPEQRARSVSLIVKKDRSSKNEFSPKDKSHKSHKHSKSEQNLSKESSSKAPTITVTTPASQTPTSTKRRNSVAPR